MTDKERLEADVMLSERLAENQGCGSMLVHLMIFALVLLFVGCCPCRKVVNTSTGSENDSTFVEHHKETITVYVHDTTWVQLKDEQKKTTTRDTTSHLENSYAVSDAAILADGSLFHSLSSKPVSIPVEYDRPETTTTETHQEYHGHQAETIKTAIIEVERSYTWWDKTRFYTLYVILGALVLYLCIKYKSIIINLIKH